MIAPITKEYFYNSVGKVLSWKKTLGIELTKFRKNKEYVESTSAIYFEKPGEGYFVYIPSFRFIAVPEQYKNLSVKDDEDIDFSGWKCKETGVGHNEEYTINLFHRASASRWCWFNEDVFKTYKKKYRGGVELEISNNKLGYSKLIEIRYEENSWSKDFFLAYKEKIPLPYDGIKLFQIDVELMNILLWSQRRRLKK